ncbi:MAG: hypothetical protein KAI79_06095 [Bacteroidales bacterium]|nr:hypothetical protein [Bacteroidales bacterium]
MRYKIYLLAALFLLGFSACEKSPFDVDISHINVDFEIKRLDLDLFNEKSNNLEELKKEYSPFFDLYSYKIIRLGNPADSLFPIYLERFTNDRTIIDVRKKCAEIFIDISSLNNELMSAFRHIKYYYPEFSAPNVYTYISGFNQSVITDSAVVGISLDKYLGANCSFYQYLEVPMYMRNRMHPSKIIFDVVEAYARMDYAKEMQKSDLISTMIYEGKIQYFMAAILPEYSDTLKLNYSGSQLKWLLDSEADMWTYLVEHKKLFETQVLDIRKFIGEAPFTSAFGNNSPPHAGIFIGRQIVFNYMKNNPNLSLNELMFEDDAMKILQQSAYHP